MNPSIAIHMLPSLYTIFNIISWKYSSLDYKYKMHNKCNYNADAFLLVKNTRNGTMMLMIYGNRSALKRKTETPSPHPRSRTVDG